MKFRKKPVVIEALQRRTDGGLRGMTEFEQLKILAKRYRWAFRELVFDAKMIEANRLYTEPATAAYKYLRIRYSRQALVLLVIKELQAYKVPVPEGEGKEFLLRVRRQYPWALGELVRAEKEKEAEALFCSVQAMYTLLKTEWGSRAAVLELLQWLTRVQRGPRKTLCI